MAWDVHVFAMNAWDKTAVGSQAERILGLVVWASAAVAAAFLARIVGRIVRDQESAAAAPASAAPLPA